MEMGSSWAYFLVLQIPCCKTQMGKEKEQVVSKEVQNLGLGCRIERKMVPLDCGGSDESH